VRYRRASPNQRPLANFKNSLYKTMCGNRNVSQRNALIFMAGFTPSLSLTTTARQIDLRDLLGGTLQNKTMQSYGRKLSHLFSSSLIPHHYSSPVVSTIKINDLAVCDEISGNETGNETKLRPYVATAPRLFSIFVAILCTYRDKRELAFSAVMWPPYVCAATQRCAIGDRLKTYGVLISAMPMAACAVRFR
jgi:hypothetical protein